MSRTRRIIIAVLFVFSVFFSGTALSQFSAHAGQSEGDALSCRPLNLITREDYLINGSHTLPTLHNGDILLTFSTHSFGWRHGHAGLVVDAEQGLVLEAMILGRPSEVVSVEHWRHYSTLMVLRLKDTTPEVGEKVSTYAAKSLIDLPYRLSSGLWGDPEADHLTVQCSYLVWYAYDHFGYNLDSDGGRLVTVADLAASPLLESIS